MDKILADLNLDVQELNYLLKTLPEMPDSPAYRMIGRKMTEISNTLDVILRKLESREQTETDQAKPTTEKEKTNEEQEEMILPVPDSPILGESLKSQVETLLSLSLNDTFRFSRDLFDNDRGRMTDVIVRASGMASYEDALELLQSEMDTEEENESFADFMDLVKNHFA